MTPLFAPKPAPAGVGFGPGFGERQRGWFQAAHAAEANPYAPPEPKPGPWATAWPPAGSGWPARFGPQWPGVNGGLGLMPVQGAHGWPFGGFDPWAAQQIRQGAQSWSDYPVIAR